MIASRDKGNAPQFFDIHFALFQQDPFPIIQQLYDFLGKNRTLQALARLRAWGGNTPKDKHEYHPEGFWLGKDALRERFRLYSDHFGEPVAA